MTELTPPQAEAQLSEEVEQYAELMLAGYEPNPVRDRKIIQDGLTGSSRFDQWEIAIIDTPIVQRLRHIHQTGLSDTVYPSANATRFAHSLGVCVTAKRFIEALNSQPGKPCLHEDDARHIRAAALLHDCGHGPFSHASEDAYRRMAAMRVLLEHAESQYKHCKPHEILSALIVRSGPMRELLTVALPKLCEGIALDPTRIASIILQLPDTDSRAYVYQVINGPFDADKLDYVSRDSHATGLQMALEIDRLFYTLHVGDNKDPERDQRVILVSTGGVHCLEQILFNKMLLTAALYHHHKVRATECVLRGVFDYVSRNGSRRLCGRRLRSPVDFLYLTDTDVLAHGNHPAKVQRAISRVRRRQLPKRALVVSAETAEPGDPIAYLEFIERMKEPGEQDAVKERVLEAARAQGVECEDPEMGIWVDLPKNVSFSEPSQTYILRENGQVIQLDELFSIENWLDAYKHFFWRGHVFAPAAVRREVGKAARRVLKEEYGVELSELAETLCKHDP